ncbi:hypothetical protein [Maricaulis sp.]|uniref:hypothetical protein n=1 Tax=Maricaulis sp. TaxID=1486257 RepID=UPI00262ACA45|nr:hypothetical protein [Maricaulis sp.]
MRIEPTWQSADTPRRRRKNRRPKTASADREARRYPAATSDRHHPVVSPAPDHLDDQSIALPDRDRALSLAEAIRSQLTVLKLAIAGHHDPRNYGLF